MLGKPLGSGITVKGLPSDGAGARKTALLIFRRKTLETLGLRYEGPSSEQFCKEMEKTSIYSGIQNIVKIGGTLNSVASGCYARALCLMPHLRVMYHRQAELADDFYREMASSGTWVKYMYHRHEGISSLSSRFLASALNTMSYLTVLCLADTPLDDDFFKVLAETAADIKLETFIVLNDSLSVGYHASRHFARGLVAMPNLRTLHVESSALDDTFYQTMRAEAKQLGIETLSIRQDRDMSDSVLHKFTTLSVSCRNLTTWFVDRFGWRVMTLAASREFQGHFRNSKVKKISIKNGLKSALLVSGIASMPELTSFTLISPGSSKTQFISALGENNKFRQISTLSLWQLTLSRKDLQMILSRNTLRSLRFLQITYESDPFLSPGEVESSVEDISMDDKSLPHLLELGLHTQCLHIEKLQIDFTGDIKDEDLISIQKFHNPSHVFLAAFRDPHKLCIGVPSVCLKDASLLLGSTASFGSHLKTLALADIHLGEREARNLIHAAKDHETLCNLTMVRCDTTCTLDSERKRLMCDGFAIKVVHGLPRTEDNYSDEDAVNDTIRMRREYYEGFFSVIYDEFESYV